jgi:hypothetical protein
VVLVGTVSVLTLLLAASTRRRTATPEPNREEPDVALLAAEDLPIDGKADVACRELVTLVTDYLDGVLPADWRA